MLVSNGIIIALKENICYTKYGRYIFGPLFLLIP